MGADAVTYIIIDPTKTDPEELAPSTPQEKVQFLEQFQPWLTHYNPYKTYLNSGDEYAYEYVEAERSYYIDTQYQKGMLVLPPNPKPGFKIIVTDYFGSWMYYPLIVHRNGKKIMGMEEHMTCDVPHMIFGLVYTETEYGWVVTQNLGTDWLKESVKKGPFQ